ncbi:amino acid transport protein gap1 [Fusarium flagelliforme]|uniref:Amino acid transport protein gap1 n=1 Tax=Fusarium flagelliforme TaxID=2675880 RepID=A0A395MYR3_9HYPO|nr:amino acid transport protein gap1 [Fusarium flagelliforme]
MATPSAMGDASIFPFTGEHGTSMSCLLEEGKYSDLTIECGEDSYTVHKAIICTRSPFFAARCDGDSKEAKSGVIKLPDDDPVAVKMVIRYLYTGTYTSPSTSASARFNGEPFQASPNLFVSAFPAKAETSPNPPAPSAPATNVFGAQPQVSVNPPAASAPVAGPPPAQPQQFVFGNQRKRHNSGNQRGNPTPNSPFQPIPAKPAPVPAQAPTSACGPAPAPVPTPAPATPALAPQRDPHFVLHAKIYALGEKYEIKDLKALALQKFAYEATFFPSYHSFRHGAKEAYTSTVNKDRGLRDVVVRTVLKNRYLLDQWSFQKVVKETDLGFDLLMKLRFAQPLFEEYSTT